MFITWFEINQFHFFYTILNCQYFSRQGLMPMQAVVGTAAPMVLSCEPRGCADHEDLLADYF